MRGKSGQIRPFVRSQYASAALSLTHAQGAVKPRFMPRTLSSPLARRLGVAAFAIASTFALVAWAQKIAVVDTQRAMMETEDGLRMQANLKKVFDTKQQELETKQQELERERADIEKQQEVVSEQAIRRRAEEWQREMIALQQMSVTYNQELQKKQAELTQPIIEKTMGIIRRIATSEGYDMVVDKQVVPYSRSDLDLPDRVITMYNGGAPVEAPAEKKDGAKKPVEKKEAAPKK
jgi:outer membrane protein